MVLEQLADVYDQYGKKWCLAAIRETVLYGGRSVRYVTRILERWARDGFQATKKGQQGEKGHAADKRRADERTKLV